MHVGPNVRACQTKRWLMCCRRMGQHIHSCKRLLRYGSRPALSVSSRQQHMNQAAALSLIVLLVAPAMAGTQSFRRLLQNRSRNVHRTAGKCLQMVGCLLCTWCGACPHSDHCLLPALLAGCFMTMFIPAGGMCICTPSSMFECAALLLACTATEWCSQQITGCSACTERVVKAAAGAQFPGMAEAPAPVSIVTCTACSSPYVFDQDLKNCGELSTRQAPL